LNLSPLAEPGTSSIKAAFRGAFELQDYVWDFSFGGDTIDAWARWLGCLIIANLPSGDAVREALTSLGEVYHFHRTNLQLPESVAYFHVGRGQSVGTAQSRDVILLDE
jgi:hypothetical protein